MTFRISAVVLLQLLIACSSSYSRYVPDAKQSYTYELGGRQVKLDLAPLHYDLEFGRPIRLSLRYAQSLAEGEKVRSVAVRLYRRGADGRPGEQLKLLRSRVEVEYWDGKRQVEVKRDNFEGDLHTLIDPAMRELVYRGIHSVHFNISNDYESAGFPKNLVQQIEIVRTEGTPELFTNTLTKVTHSKSCVSGRPFG